VRIATSTLCKTGRRDVLVYRSLEMPYTKIIKALKSKSGLNQNEYDESSFPIRTDYTKFTVFCLTCVG